MVAQAALARKAVHPGGLGAKPPLTERNIWGLPTRNREAAEIKTLAWADVDFDKAPARITIRAKNAKSKREDVIPICDTLASALMTWREAEKARLGQSPEPNERVLHIGSRFRDSFKADCKAAAIKERDASGLYFDIHALRHSFASWLARAGTHPKVAQELLRHTDVRLTLKAYTHTTREQQLTALASLPKLENCAPNVTTDVTRDVTTAAADGDEGSPAVSAAGNAVDRQDGEDYGGEGQKKTGADHRGQPLSGVEAGGIEPPSRSSSPRASTCVGYLLVVASADSGSRDSASASSNRRFRSCPVEQEAVASPLAFAL